MSRYNCSGFFGQNFKKNYKSNQAFITDLNQLHNSYTKTGYIFQQNGTLQF